MVTETYKSQMPNKEVATKRQQAKLLATRDRMLIEGNDWGDTFWGMVDGEGENNLGKILMRVREEIKTDLKGKFEQEN
ncbi:NADAR family protein [uncultured Veillonella sp.]|uniref:NADAR family protein n=1 Tax=uncultured Veillonella sp. TaxID=159268 RepID=UPI00280BA1A1|nr:NADAR family protein [uncultured Veillonella sp.]